MSFGIYQSEKYRWLNERIVWQRIVSGILCKLIDEMEMICQEPKF